MRAWRGFGIFVAVVCASAVGWTASERKLDVRGFRLVERASGPVNYYTILTDTDPPRVHSAYVPGLKTSVVGRELTDEDRKAGKRLRFRWRALQLPAAGDECVASRADSAAVVYVSWKRGLRYYTLKYVWSAVGKRGAVCDSKRNPFLAQDTVILESGGPLAAWKTVELDLASEFRKHFEDGNASAAVPDLIGIGLMSDGDQTNSPSSAEFAEFRLSP